MAFSSENPPLWFRIIVYISIGILALGLIFLAERKGLDKWINALNAKQTEIEDLFERRLVSVSELSDGLKNEESMRLRDFGILLKSMIPVHEMTALRVDDLSKLYLRLDDTLNSCVIELSKSYGKAIPSHLLIPVRTLMENEKVVGDSIATYHEQVTNYDRAVASVLNILATSVMDLPEYFEYTMVSALGTPY